MQWIRDLFGTKAIAAIMGSIMLVFVFYGVFSPKATRGIHEGAVAGKVNGDAISIAEFNRELNRRLEFFKTLGGGTISEEQIKMFRVREGVFDELARRKLMVQEAYREGMLASDEQVRDAIRELPYFQKEGRFDLAQYRQVLSANQYSPGGFERMLREDLSVQRWNDYFRRRAVVTPEEARKEYGLQNDKRTIKYVVLNNETGRHGVDVSAEELKKYLADAAKLNVAKGQYEGRKATDFKGKTFEDVRDQIARELIAGDKLDQIQKVNDGLAEKVKAAMGTGKAADAKVDAILKAYGTQLRSSPAVTRMDPRLPGVGEPKDIVRDAFADKSPIDGTAGGQPKVYKTAGTTVIALVSDKQTADSAKFEAERPKLMTQIAGRKQQELFQGWIKGLYDQAKIETNPSVVGGEEG